MTESAQQLKLRLGNPENIKLEPIPSNQVIYVDSAAEEGDDFNIVEDLDESSEQEYMEIYERKYFQDLVNADSYHDATFLTEESKRLEVAGGVRTKKRSLIKTIWFSFFLLVIKIRKITAMKIFRM